jgi:hypothetical protein
MHETSPLANESFVAEVADNEPDHKAKKEEKCLRSCQGVVREKPVQCESGQASEHKAENCADGRQGMSEQLKKTEKADEVHCVYSSAPNVNWAERESRGELV